MVELALDIIYSNFPETLFNMALTTFNYHDIVPEFSPTNEMYIMPADGLAPDMKGQGHLQMCMWLQDCQGTKSI